MRYEFTAELWRHSGAAGWHFVTLPSDLSQRIRTIAGGLLNSFGSLRVIARVGSTSWKTSVFFDRKANAFLLPVKADVRRKARINAGDKLDVALELEL